MANEIKVLNRVCLERAQTVDDLTERWKASDAKVATLEEALSQALLDKQKELSQLHASQVRISLLCKLVNSSSLNRLLF